MSSAMEPLPPWLRDLNRFFTSEGGVAPFVPPADVTAADDGVTVHMDLPGSPAIRSTSSSSTTC